MEDDENDETPSDREPESTPEPEPEPVSKQDDKPEDKVEDGNNGKSDEHSDSSESKGPQEQISEPTAKLVKPGTTVAREQSAAASVQSVKLFKPKSGPHFLKRLRKPPVTDPTVETN